MKHRLLAVITTALAATVTVTTTPTGGAPVAQAVACNLEGVPVLFPPLSPGVSRLAEWQSYSNPGAAVKCLEQRLAELGYTVNAPDSTYDATTKAAVQQYQLTRGYHADGVVSPDLMRQMGLRGTLPSGPTVPTATLLGDSVSAAMRWTDEINSNYSSSATTRYDIMGNSYDLIWSLESCRRLVSASCTSRTGRYTTERPAPVSVLPLMRGSLAGRMGQAIVISAGYDDTSITSAIEQIMTEARDQGIARVYWMTYRYDPARSYPYKQYYIKHNQDLQAAKVRWPNLVVLDWNAHSAGQTSWITSDGIHLTATGATAFANFIKAALDSSDIATCTAGSAQAGVPDPTPETPPAPPAVETGFVGVAPVRVLDTRAAEYGGGNGRLGVGRTIEVDLDGLIPADAESVVVNVTAVKPCTRGFLTVFACGTRPETSNVNFVASRTTAGIAVSPHSDGALCVYSSAAVDVVVDLVGAFVPEGQLFHPLAPDRWVDTRGNPARLTIGGPLTTGQEIDVDIAGLGDVPEDAESVWINLTGTAPTLNAVLQVYPGPCGTPPTTSTVNVLAGRAAAVTAMVTLGANGGICVRAHSGTPHVIIDVAGYFGGASPDGLAYQAVAAERILDTRPGDVPSAGVDVPVELEGTSLVSVAAVVSTDFGFVSAKPCGVTAVSSLLNTAPNESVANVGAIAPGTADSMCLNPSIATDLLVDLAGIFVTPTPVPG